MTMFNRYVSVDWSGRGREHERVPIGVVAANFGEQAEVIHPPRFPVVKNWSRAECVQWLGTQLSLDNPRTIVAFDFGFGLPWGADQAVFGCSGWRAMIQALAELYARNGTARAAAKRINENPRFEGRGPYRFNEGRTDFRFYLRHGVAYYRLVETAVPQAISQWYLGAGGTVGFHTITGLAALNDLIARRETGRVRFRIWPQECEHPMDLGDSHVIVESYPALYPKPASFGPCTTDDQCDAWKVLLWMSEADARGRLAESFSPPTQRLGRIDGTSFWDQVRFEGWILGVDCYW